MAQTIKLKRSATTGNVPTTSQLALGELGINTTDGKLFLKKSVSGTESIVEVGSTDSFLPLSGGTLTGNLTIPEYIYHSGDTNTSLRFTDDAITLRAGAFDTLQVTPDDVNIVKTLDLDPANNTYAINAKVDYTTGASTNRGIFLDFNVSGNDAATADHVHSGLHIDADSSYTGGDTSNEGRLYGAYVQATSSGDNDLVTGGRFFAQTSGTNSSASTATSNVVGLEGYADQNRALANTNMYGTKGITFVDNAGATGTVNCNAAYGIYGKHTQHTGGTSGTTTTATGAYGEVEVAEGTVTTAYGVRTVIDHNGGTIGTGYLFSGTYTGTIGTKWGIVTTGASYNKISGTFRSDDGVASNPTYSFNSDTNTGMYSVSDNVIGFSTNGSPRLKIENTGIEVLGTATMDGLTVDNITIDGNEIDVSSGGLTLDVAGDIVLDAHGNQVLFKGSSGQIGFIDLATGRMDIKASNADADMRFQGNDGGVAINALTLDMSNAGAATFNSTISSGAITSSGSLTANHPLTLNNTIAGNDTGDFKILQSLNASGGVGFAASVLGVNIDSAVNSNNFPTQDNVWGGVTGSAALVMSADISDSLNSFRFMATPQSSAAGTVLSTIATMDFEGGFTANGYIRSDSSYKIGTTTVIDSSRNLTNIGTISSGAITSSGIQKFTKSVYGSEDSENYFRIKLQDQGGVHNDVGIGQTQTGNMGFNVTAGQEFIFNLGTVGHAAWINSNGVDAKLGGFRINGTTVIDDSRNLTNIHDVTFDGVVRSTNNANVDGANFNVSTTNKDGNEYAYRVDRSGTVVAGIQIDGDADFKDVAVSGDIKSTSLSIYSGGNRSEPVEGKEYKYFLCGTGLYDGLWKKVCDVTVGTGLYRALSMKITLESLPTNFGNQTGVQTSTFSAAYYRSADTQDNPDNADLRGQNTSNHQLRILKTATGVYELQIKQLVNHKDAIVNIEVLNANAGAVSVPSSITNGSTTGTAYTASTSINVKSLYNEIDVRSVVSDSYNVGTQEVITSSRALTNIATISSGAITSSASVIASGNSNSFGNTTIGALSVSTVTASASITASGNSNSFGNTTLGTISSGAITSTGTITTTGGNIDIRKDGTGDGSNGYDINFMNSAAQGTDDRLALIRVTNQGGDGTSRGGKLTLFTRQSGNANFNSALILDKDGNATFSGSVTSTTGFTTGANTRVQSSSGMLFVTGAAATVFEVGAGSEKMRLLSTGLGIGTSSPSQDLHIREDSGDCNLLIDSANGASQIFFGDDESVNIGIIRYDHSSNFMRFNVNGSERTRIASNGTLYHGKTADSLNTGGLQTLISGQTSITQSYNEPLRLNRMSSEGAIQKFYYNGAEVGSIGSEGGDTLYIGTSDTGLRFHSADRIVPHNPATNTSRDAAIDLGRASERFKDIYLSGKIYGSTLGIGDAGIQADQYSNAVKPFRPDITSGTSDNYLDLGTSSVRWVDIYATNGTIQTSDRNEKQDIEDLTDAEERVAIAAKGLLKKFRWKSAVEDKGDDARIHFGIIAQDLQAAFEAEGLDAGRYGMFTSNTWTNEDGEEQTRMGVRYSELLAFIISAI